MALQDSEVGTERTSFSYDGILNCKLNRSLNKTGSVRINVTPRRVCVTIVAVKKAVSFTYHECVFVALGIQHAMRMRHSVICGLPGSLILFDIIS
jgi:hypothetical protein